VIGRISQAPTGEPAATRPEVTLRFTYDERIEDGFYCARSLQLFQQRVEDPAAWLAGA
jgi:pyruvate/2-oxoglutarate dehydrogenase complex dihydrolipoamide acyltransferase (E2) component